MHIKYLKIASLISFTVLLGGCTVYEVQTPNGVAWTNQPNGYIAVPATRVAHNHPSKQHSVTVINEHTKVNNVTVIKPPAPNPHSKGQHKDKPAAVTQTQPTTSSGNFFENAAKTVEAKASAKPSPKPSVPITPTPVHQKSHKKNHADDKGILQNQI